MGRAKKAKGIAKRAPGTAAGKEQAAAREDVEALLVAAEDALDRMEHGDALELLRRARSAEREGDRAASRLGELLADMGRMEEAVRVLLEAVKRCPEAGHEKFMHLGQLLADPDEARAMLARGTALLRVHAGDAARMGLPEAAHLRGQLVSALCAAAELELRACAEAASPEDRDAAASACDRLVSDAMECDADSPDPYQVLCSLRIEQDRREEAGRALQACTDRTDAIMGEAALLNAIEAGLTFGHADHAAAAREPPSFEFRYENAKLLLELGRPGRAAATLEALVEECDDNPDVWYLLGLAYHLKRDGEAAAECLGKAQEAMAMATQQDGGSGGGGGGGETQALVRELLEEIHQEIRDDGEQSTGTSASWHATWAENNVRHSVLGPDEDEEELEEEDHEMDHEDGE